MKSTWPASTPSDSELDLPLKSDLMTLFLLPCSLNALVICLGLAKFVSPKVCISYTLQNMETRDDQLGPTARLVCANTVVLGGAPGDMPLGAGANHGTASA